jgi:predicted metal-dependent phosphoesterase TrpH
MKTFAEKDFDVNADKRFDMHVHTTASDGAYTPAEIVRQAAALGLTGLAITDHDTLDGLGEAAEEAKRLGLRLIFGVELSCEQAVPDVNGEPHEVHMLGYFLDPDKQAFSRRLRELQAHRRVRAEKILARLAECGMPLDGVFLAAYAEEGSAGRGLIGRKLVEAGYVRSVDEAFERWLGVGCPAYVPRMKLTAVEAVQLLHENGGVAVMAHPVQSGDDRLIPLLAAVGLDGLECCHPDHDEALTEHYRQLASELDLVMTGGSDCHVGGLGAYTANEAEIAALLERRCRNNQNNKFEDK